jgi:uncharacterized protein YcaQ
LVLSLSADEARRIALTAQGFGRAKPRRVDRRQLRRVLDELAVVQLDSVNVCCRAHYMPFFSRLGAYDRDALDAYLNVPKGDAFEYWGHVASVMPVDLYPYFDHRRESMDMWRNGKAVLAKHRGYVKKVREEVTAVGPLTISELSDPGARTGPWWGYGKGKLALELLFMTGQVTARRGKNFIRVYDTPERSIPGHVREVSAPKLEDQYRELLLRSARSLGVGTARDLADYYRLNIPRVRKILAEMVEGAELREVAVEGWRDAGFVTPDLKRPRKVSGATALLSPFDSLIFERDRTERIFGFRYRIEIYVPAKKREFGYYVYPFLLDGDLVARVDLKTDRKAGCLPVLGAYAEPNAPKKRTAGELAASLRDLATWLGLEKVTVGRRGSFAPDVRRALSQ